MPRSRQFSSTAAIFRRGMLVHVRCIIVSMPSTFSIVLASSKVSSAVLPPAPQVTSTNAGSSRPMRSIRA